MVPVGMENSYMQVLELQNKQQQKIKEKENKYVVFFLHI
jgi:hypothetical protein